MKKQIIPTKSLTDWARIDAMTDEDIDYSDCPEATPEMFARAVVRLRTKPISKKEKSTVQIDSDVLSWFKSKGRGYQTQINALLREYMESHKI